MEITDEMRQAIRAEDCIYYGHQFDFRNVNSETQKPNPNDPQGEQFTVLRARDTNKLPHVTCPQCRQVWLVIDEPGADYDDAIAKVAQRLADLGPDDTSALAPAETPGLNGVPIPLAPGVVWEDLPNTHPAVARASQVDGEWGFHSEITDPHDHEH